MAIYALINKEVIFLSITNSCLLLGSTMKIDLRQKHFHCFMN